MSENLYVPRSIRERELFHQGVRHGRAAWPIALVAGLLFGAMAAIPVFALLAK